MNACIVCETALNPLRRYDYQQCPQCHSYVYFSDIPAAVENKRYFNDHYEVLKHLQIMKAKRKIFAKFARRDRVLRKNQFARFDRFRKIPESALKTGKRVLEVGFGEGHRLANLLQKGVDAYGIDISEVAVDHFVKKYPQYKHRVFCNARFAQAVDTVYCCALFEHLDDPSKFLENCFQCLNPGGKLILDGVPVLNRRKSELGTDEDINFWKPCHRIIYSLEGMLALVQAAGFAHVGNGSVDDFNYRVLSLHQKLGFAKVSQLRNPCFDHPELPDSREFNAICKSALNITSLALFCNAVFEKPTQNI